MTRAEIFSKIKKPLIIFISALIVFAVSLVALDGISANAEAASTTSVANSIADNSISDDSEAASGGEYLAGLLDVNDNNGSLELMLLITLLSIAPSLLVMMTCFTRIIIVFSFLRNALGTQQNPPNQVLVGLALFLTFFIMSPVFKEINEVAYTPYKDGEYTTIEAAKAAAVPLKSFMLKNTNNESMQFILDLSGTEVTFENPEEIGLQYVIPAFIISELKRAFIMGFLLYIPFLIIDIIVSSTLMSMGMIMLPPTLISLPFKLLLFIVVDGWELIIGTLASGFFT